MARKRNYRAEYQRRIARAQLKGYSKAVARGHPPKGKAGLRAADFLGIKPGDELQELKPAKSDLFGDIFRGNPQLKYVLSGFDRHGNAKWRFKVVVDDSRKTFGRKPRRETGEDAATYAEKLLEIQRREGRFNWTDEATFIKAMLDLGMTAQDAYTHWFSP